MMLILCSRVTKLSRVCKYKTIAVARSMLKEFASASLILTLWAQCPAYNNQNKEKTQTIHYYIGINMCFIWLAYVINKRKAD